ncbi:MAG: hypothetical protein RIF41_15920, partial [Polyangiaceae bacterium]
SVSITMPAVTGPHTSVNATLSMTKNVIRKSTSVGDQYAEKQGGDTRFLYDFAKIQSICTSSGVNDAGVFELRFDDSRLVPFEGAGAVSTWRLEMEQARNRFDMQSLSDVVMHIQYTARSGAVFLEKAAEAELAASTDPAAYRLVRVSHEFPNAWQLFVAGDGGGQHTLEFSLQGKVPYMHLGGSEVAKVQSVAIAGVGAPTPTGASVSYTLEGNGSDLGDLVAPYSNAVSPTADAETTSWTYVATGVDDVTTLSELYFIFELVKG